MPARGREPRKRTSTATVRHAGAGPAPAAAEFRQPRPRDHQASRRAAAQPGLAERQGQPAHETGLSRPRRDADHGVDRRPADLRRARDVARRARSGAAGVVAGTTPGRKHRPVRQGVRVTARRRGGPQARAGCDGRTGGFIGGNGTGDRSGQRRPWPGPRDRNGDRRVRTRAARISSRARRDLCRIRVGQDRPDPATDRGVRVERRLRHRVGPKQRPCAARRRLAGTAEDVASGRRRAGRDLSGGYGRGGVDAAAYVRAAGQLPAATGLRGGPGRAGRVRSGPGQRGRGARPARERPGTPRGRTAGGRFSGRPWTTSRVPATGTCPASSTCSATCRKERHRSAGHTNWRQTCPRH